jgi:hypothetical protein
MGKREILGLHGRLAPGEGFFASRQRSLTPLNFALRNAFHILCHACRTKDRQAHRDETR